MIRAENVDVIVGTLNINSKFDDFKLMASILFDVIIVKEIKLNDPFPKA